MKRFSFFVNHLGPNQVSYLLYRNIPRFIQENPDHDICVFYENIFQHSFSNHFCVLSSNELWGYNATCVSIGLEMGEKLLKIPTIKKKFHFLLDFDWTFRVFNTERLNKFYSDQNIEFLVRNEAYALEFKNRWNRDCKIVGDLDVSEISKII